MGAKKGFVVWNEDKVNVGQLIELGKTDEQIIEDLKTPPIP